MNDPLITFETAKLAKEKGFEQSPFAIQTSYCLVYKNSDEVMIRNSLFNPSSIICTAPTQSLLQKWLREVHKYDVRPSREEDHWIFGYCEFSHGNKSTQSCVPFDTYEKALEWGLKTVLKLI